MAIAPLTPWRSVASLPDLSLDLLEEEGVRLVLVDRDNTVVPRDSGIIPEDVRAWLEAARARGIALCLVSNNFHSSQVSQTARDLDIPVVDHAMKPAPFALLAACRRCGVPPEQTVLVGDQVFTDVLAAHLASVRAVLVEPQSSEDLWYTRVMRLVEPRPRG